MKSMITLISALAISCLAFCGCASANRSALNLETPLSNELGLTFEYADIQIDGVKQDRTFLWIADLHVFSEDLSEVEPQSIEIAKNRRDSHFLNPRSGKKAREVWDRLPDFFNASGADAVLLGGDICDVGSVANIQELKNGFSRMTIPFMYLRADHDVRPWWLIKEQAEKVNELEKAIDGNKDTMVLDYGDFMVVGFNNSCFQMTASGLADFKKACAAGKPIILALHVPLHSSEDPSFREICIAHDDNLKRDLTWGANCYYKPNKTTQEFLDLVYAADSPVKAVIAGHLHFQWEGKVTPNATQYLFNPSFQGTVGVIRVTGKR